jgi:hypothetical protein
MERRDQVRVIGRQKPKKRKSPAKIITSASIARRYMELRRLRERVSEVESLGGPQ